MSKRTGGPGDKESTGVTTPEDVVVWSKSGVEHASRPWAGPPWTGSTPSAQTTRPRPRKTTVDEGRVNVETRVCSRGVFAEGTVGPIQTPDTWTEERSIVTSVKDLNF